MKALFTEKAQSYKDNRFEQKGVQLQYDSMNWWEAKRNYNYSCMLCCLRNVGAEDCARCPIREAMLVNSIIFWKKMPKQEHEWVRKEKELL